MYREQHQRCPACAAGLIDAGSTRACPACQGVWVAEAVLTEMVRRMHDGVETLPLEWATRESGEVRACPACGAPMAAVTFEGIPVERCEEHGVWFDVHELERGLHAATERPPRHDGEVLDLGPGHEPDLFGRGGSDPSERWLWQLIKRFETRRSRR